MDFRLEISFECLGLTVYCGNQSFSCLCLEGLDAVVIAETATLVRESLVVGTK